MQTFTKNTIYLLKLNLWLVINFAVGAFLFISPNMDFIFLALVAFFSGNILLPKNREKVDFSKKLNRKELWQIVGVVCVLIVAVFVWEFFKSYSVLNPETSVQALSIFILLTSIISYIKHLRTKNITSR
jgi:hypothetical protein